MGNTTKPDTLTRATRGNFFVMATKPIETPKRVIEPGTYILIQPDAKPVKGRLVLVGARLEPWNAQPDIRGVATMTYETMEDYQRGLRIAA